MHLQTEAHTHTQELGTHADVLPRVLNHCFLFCLQTEAEPHQPWCHWWGHCLGHQQLSEEPQRPAGNHEVMDQHTLAPTHTHMHTSSVCSSSWFLGHLTQLSISGSSSSLWKLHTMILLLDGESDEGKPNAKTWILLCLIIRGENDLQSEVKLFQKLVHFNSLCKWIANNCWVWKQWWQYIFIC